MPAFGPQNMEITPVIPPDDAPLELDHLDCSTTGNEIGVVDDMELDISTPIPTIELLSQDSKIRLYVDCPRPQLIMHLKFIKKFMDIEIICLDDKNIERIFRFSNKTSFVTVKDNICRGPIQAKDGWQYVPFDLAELCANAFGVYYNKCVEITISGGIRISKLFFQSKAYADIELPTFLRVVHT